MTGTWYNNYCSASASTDPFASFWNYVEASAATNPHFYFTRWAIEPEIYFWNFNFDYDIEEPNIEKSIHGKPKGKLKHNPPKPPKGYKHIAQFGRGSPRFCYMGRRGQ